MHLGLIYSATCCKCGHGFSIVFIVISKFIIASLLAFSLGCMAFVCKAMFYLIFLLQDLAPVTCMVSLTKPGKRE